MNEQENKNDIRYWNDSGAWFNDDIGGAFKVSVITDVKAAAKGDKHLAAALTDEFGDAPIVQVVDAKGTHHYYPITARDDIWEDTGRELRDKGFIADTVTQ